MSIAILTAAAANEAAAAQKFGLIPALNEGGPISWAIFSVMVIMSVFSFYIMFTKLIEQQKVLNQAKQVRAGFWRAATLEEGAAKLDKNSAFRQLVDDGISAQKQHGLLTDPVEAHDWLHNAMSRSEDSINNKLAGGLPFLATVGATAPFVGLLGTVIGIYSALIKIGIAGQADIGKIAGPVGEALIMTAIGLFVAVPAVLAYNWLQSRNKTIARELSTFSNNVLGYITSGGKVKPAVSAAPAAKPAAAPAAAVKK
ncbi:MAG: MotA/TolQ/ExbB proton channel family protein [Sphingomonadales bacterium]|jgi:biopolymer transport protein ExbB|nr:MotA/TolQ/ExbB proton channel family protein [Sphingomonadales bacterium]MBK9004533.1 MotA/TolQ/ExbB proton channel family protein [Sphingomonadales bacterium]MBK9269720.1 MotA/TolQ/ExbB proton channel family protein [Sphingomonadales bacterium]MBP6435192.1 MotA/TolQ/ExbB proton channel family protein [Sphingorhabdus sp.]